MTTISYFASEKKCDFMGKLFRENALRLIFATIDEDYKLEINFT